MVVLVVARAMNLADVVPKQSYYHYSKAEQIKTKHNGAELRQVKRNRTTQMTYFHPMVKIPGNGHVVLMPVQKHRS
jgi:hypothetical protein